VLAQGPKISSDFCSDIAEFEDIALLQFGLVLCGQPKRKL
jgi:hypothetical protein